MIRKTRCIATLALGVAFTLPSLAGAMDHGSMDHGSMGHGMGAEMKSTDAAKPSMKGKEVRTADVQGYHLTYRLIDMNEMMKGMPMKEMDMGRMKSHHLMVYVAGPDGKTVSDAKIGYMVVGPDKAEQKTMTMAMQGGFGADVDFKAKGTYKVTAKAVVGEKTLLDEFSYTVK